MREKWYERRGASGGICVSTRVRFARNLARFPFPGRMSDEQARSLISLAAKALSESGLGSQFRLVDMEQLSALERAALVERHIISPALAELGEPRAVLVSADESMSVMINEEDHLRIQVLAAGLDADAALERARALDETFDRALGYAFDETLGYLTKCPTNLGTAMRVSVMLHLPATEAARQSGAVVAAASNAGLTARGIYGEGSSAEGALYQFSNRASLGLSEDEVCERLERVAKQMIERERLLRERQLERDRVAAEDRAWRAVGALRFARRMDTAEALRLLGEVRVGVSLGILPTDIGRLNGLLWAIRAASLTASAGRDMTAAERDVARAALLRVFD